jgi:flavin reductase ActVB
MIAIEDFKRTLAHLAGAVTIITTCDAAGQPYGFTATSLCSLSLEPPLVLFCLGRSADCYRVFAGAARVSPMGADMDPEGGSAPAARQKRAPCFAVNLLSAEQEGLARLFATKGGRKYRETRFVSGRTGAPLLPEALAILEGHIWRRYPGGDHGIFVGLVEHGMPFGDASDQSSQLARSPLLYYLHRYGTFASWQSDHDAQYLREIRVNDA